jgi:hypothetical protein
VVFPPWISARAPGLLGLGPPSVPIVLGLSQPSLQLLDLGMEVPGVDRQLNALVLRLRELRAQLGVLDHYGQEFGGALPRIVHTVPCPTNAGVWGLA